VTGDIIPRHEGAQLRTCRDCAALFSLSPGSQAFFLELGLRLPLRCGKCRARRKAARTQAASQAEHQR
jgi:hypothetical protein